MNPDEKELLKRSLKLSEDNNKILHKLERRARWAFVWGFIKFLVIIIPLIIGFLFLQPYFEPLKESFETFQVLLSR